MEKLKCGDKIILSGFTYEVLGYSNGYREDEVKTLAIESEFGTIANFSEEYLNKHAKRI